MTKASQNKFRSPPLRKSVVNRARLLKTINVNDLPRLVLLTAPPGFGKTTLMSQWFEFIAAKDIPVAWLSIEEHRSDHTSFSSLLNEAIEAATEQRNNDYERIILFIDDFHHLKNPAVEESIKQKLLAADDQCCFIIGSRHKPTLPLGRLRMLGEVRELGAVELRFLHSEALEFFREVHNIELSDDLINKVNDKVEGWAAALQLVGASIDSNSPDKLFEKISGQNRDIVEFLAADVFNREASHVQQFLLDTSVCPRFSVELCRELTIDGKGHELLAEVEQRNLFLTPIDAEKKWYRYHQVFREFIVSRLENIDQKRACSQRRKAAQWFAQNAALDGDVTLYSDAVKLALESGNTGLAAEILDQGCEEIFKSGNLAPLMSFTSQIPDMELSLYPKLQLMRVWALDIELRIDDAKLLLEEVQSNLDRENITDNKSLDYLRAIAIHREMIIAHSLDHLEETEQFRDICINSYPSKDPYLLATLRNVDIYIKRERYQAKFANMDDRQGLVLYGTSYGRIWWDCVTGPSLVALGELTRAAEMYQRALTESRELEDSNVVIQAMPAVLLAQAKWEQGHLNEARAVLEQYGKVLYELGIVDQLIAGFLTLAGLKCVVNEHNQALQVLADAIRLADSRNLSRLKAAATDECLRILCQDGEVGEALKLAKKENLLKLIERPPPARAVTSIDEWRMLSWSRIAIVSGDYLEAIGIMKSWLRFVEERAYTVSYLRIAMLCCHALIQKGDQGEAKKLLKTALRKGQREGFIGCWVRSSSAVWLKIEEIAEANNNEIDLQDYCCNIISTVGSPTKEKSVKRALIQTGHMENLTSRELEVLRLVGKGWVNRDIASELDISVATVKYHLQQIYQKLDVHRRSDALNKARAAGLIAS